MSFYVDAHDNDLTGTTYIDFGTHALEIQEDGNLRVANKLGVGVSPDANVQVHVKSSSSTFAQVRVEAASDGYDSSVSYVQNGTIKGISGYDDSNDTVALKYGTFGGSGIDIDSSGRVGINNNSPGTFFSQSDNLIVGPLSGDNGITICSGTSGLGSIFFADGDSGADEYRGQIRYGHNGNYMMFVVNAGEMMRLTTSGLSVGSSSGATHPKLDIIPGTTSGDSQIRFRNNNSSGTVANIKAMQTNGTIDRIAIGTAESEHLTIDVSGAVKARNGGSNLKQVARVHSATITGNASTTSFTVTHNLETEDITVSVRDISTRTMVECAVVLNASATDTAVDIRFNSAPASGKTYKVTVVG